MTRKTWLKTFTASLLPLALLGAKKPDIWSTPQGLYVLALRDELKRLGHWDDLPEDWQLVVDSLQNGQKFFDVWTSRQTDTKVYYRIVPISYRQEKIQFTETKKLDALLFDRSLR